MTAVSGTPSGARNARTSNRLVILGAGGDLTGRYLLRALAELISAGQLPDDLEVVGVSQDDWDDAAFQAHATVRLDRHASDLALAARADLVHRLRYVRGDAGDPATVRAAIGDGHRRVLVYMALPPFVFAPAIHALATADLDGKAGVVVEKPFGTDLESAQRLNSLLAEHFVESSVFRIDHFLGKQTVQNVLGLRFANRLFEPLWCREHIARVDIVWDESVALEGRAGYYDHTGALRDMIQNHLLQLLCFVAMERPAGLGEKPLRDAKVEVLRAVRRLDRGQSARYTVRGRYGSGQVGNVLVPDYTAERGVDASRGTETYAEVTAFVDNERWQGVPFLLRTGKALGRDRRFIRISFREVDRLPFGQPDDPGPNIVTLSMNPDRLTADIALNGAGDPFCLDPATIELELAPQELSAYARLLVDALEGDPSLATRGDEAEESWRIVEPVLAAWSDGAVPLVPYAAGSRGPAASQLDEGGA